MRFRKEQQRSKTLMNCFIWILVVLFCFLLVVGLDYGVNSAGWMKGSASKKSKYEEEEEARRQLSIAMKEKESKLKEKFRFEFGEVIRKKIGTTDAKLPSDMQALSLLSDVYSSYGEGVNFIQVGACDGEFLASNDPIQKLLQKENWHGVLMEPVPYLFEKLKKNVDSQMFKYKERLYLMNAALSDNDGQQTFYIVNEKFAQEKPDETHALKHQIGSFNKNHIVKHLIKLRRRNELKLEVEDYIQPIGVRSATPGTVVREFFQSGLAVRNGNIDVLLIDAEGYDFVVLKSFMNMPSLKPLIVIYENLHLSEADQISAEALLTSFGYSVWPVGWNSIGVKIADL
ncbi:Methyltransferase FkbM [Reticulomyxa filosa]|uniref:Methyltransferase FkbM n=1 Tax=Reticulomyxa filosa TaxID=46433 RepID=X6NVP3_RETFI|nr:Methyltransferase FkbM [Reticulomyxa filosa]|eukprot:ETO29869.1 Methyltransferase FkbM [Reticulomyxa filosa]